MSLAIRSSWFSSTVVEARYGRWTALPIFLIFTIDSPSLVTEAPNPLLRDTRLVMFFHLLPRTSGKTHGNAHPLAGGCASSQGGEESEVLSWTRWRLDRCFASLGQRESLLTLPPRLLDRRFFCFALLQAAKIKAKPDTLFVVPYEPYAMLVASSL